MTALPPDAGAGYDPEAVAADARQADPGLPADVAARLARQAWQHLREVGEPDAPEVARRLMAGPGRTPATHAAVVAKAAVDFCLREGVDPRG